MQSVERPRGPLELGLEIDLLLDGYRLNGITREVNERTRLGDVLNAQEQIITLNGVTVFSMKGRALEVLTEAGVEKRTIVAAVPRETVEYLARQRMYRAGMSRPSRDHVRALVMMPPYAAKGSVYVLPGAELTRVGRAVTSRFFPMTDAQIFRGDDRIFEGPIALLNGDMVASIGRIVESENRERATELSEMPLPG